MSTKSTATPVQANPPETVVAHFVLPLTFERDTKSYRVLATPLDDTNALIISRDGRVYLSRTVADTLPPGAQIVTIQVTVR